MQLYDAPPPTNSGTDEYSYQPGYLGGYAYAEGEYYGYDAYHEYNFKECCHYCGYADSVSAYIEDWDLDSAYSGYIGYAPDEDYGEAYVYGELEYYYEYIPIHGYVRRYMHSRGDIQAYGGYIGFAPLSIPVLPPLPTMPSDFTNIVDVPISVTTVPDIQTAIDWIGINGNTANAYRIRLNFPGNQAIGTTTINFDVGHHIIVDSYNNYNQVWFHHATTRHLSIG
ncbi:MAG: hypothetical protein FWC73_13565, partial [Defluviitaleaceae bacterium]|nr:hypothetical protein [Defluviitaleaceae bacterium]